jgi:hypothetical protein
MLESYVITYVLSTDSGALNSVRLLSHDPRRTAAGYPLQPPRGISASRTGDYERVLVKKWPVSSIAFSFGAFIEGAAGFGAPVAISAALSGHCGVH